MAELSAELLVTILDQLEEKGDPYYPVSLLAHDVGQSENPKGECATLSDEFVSHMLHLQDLECIENIHGDCAWGYNPNSTGDSLHEKIEESQSSHEWSTPHCYMGSCEPSVIRITAAGRQLKNALTDPTITEKVKRACIDGGGAVVRQVLTKVAVSGIAA